MSDGKKDDFHRKIHSIHPNNPWGFCTSGRIQYKSVDCFLRHLICRYHVPNQKWVRKRSVCTLLVLVLCQLHNALEIWPEVLFKGNI